MPLDLSAPPVAGISFRPVEARDEGFLRTLYRGVRDAELAQTGWNEAAKRAFTDSQFEHQDRWYRDQYRDAQLLMIEERGMSIGRLYLCEFPGELRIMDIALVPERRGKGLGTALIEWLKRLAAPEARSITLYVESFNPARQLYSRLGFTEESADAFHIRMRWAPGAS